MTPQAKPESPREDGHVDIPTWLVLPILGVIGALLGSAVTWGSIQDHVNDESKHINSELVLYRLDELSREVREMKDILRERFPDEDVSNPGQ